MACLIYNIWCDSLDTSLDGSLHIEYYDCSSNFIDTVVGDLDDTTRPVCINDSYGFSLYVVGEQGQHFVPVYSYATSTETSCAPSPSPTPSPRPLPLDKLAPPIQRRGGSRKRRDSKATRGKTHKIKSIHINKDKTPRNKSTPKNGSRKRRSRANYKD